MYGGKCEAGRMLDVYRLMDKPHLLLRAVMDHTSQKAELFNTVVDIGVIVSQNNLPVCLRFKRYVMSVDLNPA